MGCGVKVGRFSLPPNFRRSVEACLRASPNVMMAVSRGRQTGSFSPTPATTRKGLDSRAFNMEPMSFRDETKTVVLVDSGYFVGRQKKHWLPKGAMRKAHNAFKKQKLNWFERQYHFQKAIKSDISYCEVVMSRMKSNPKYDKTCEAIVCFDGIKGRQLRGSIYEEYKSSRNGGLEVKASEHEGQDTRTIFTNVSLDPEALAPRWSAAYDESKEADDLIAEYTMEALLKGKNVVILSSDSDLFQMLRYPNVRLHNFRKEVTAEDVLEQTGVSVEKYADWKALVGDSSDSIPGVPGIGNSKATSLLNQHSELESIPLDEFRVFYAKSKIELANKLRSLRSEKEWSMSKCKKDFGSIWDKLEDGEEVRMNSEQIRKLTQAFDISGYLVFDDYYNRALIWKRLVRLPFGDGQRLLDAKD